VFVRLTVEQKAIQSHVVASFMLANAFAFIYLVVTSIKQIPDQISIVCVFAVSIVCSILVAFLWDHTVVVFGHEMRCEPRLQLPHYSLPANSIEKLASVAFSLFGRSSRKYIRYAITIFVHKVVTDYSRRSTHFFRICIGVQRAIYFCLVCGVWFALKYLLCHQYRVSYEV
jgi:hypothetical protein